MKALLNNRTNVSKLNKFLIYLLLVILFYYLTYRYVFSINNSKTSPTYSDTSTLLILGKYILIGMVFCFVTLLNIGKAFSLRYPLKDLGFIYFSFIVPALYGILTKNIYLIESFVFLPLFIIPKILYDRTNLIEITQRFIQVTFYLFIGFQIFQFFNFIFFGSLPALGYGGLAVRFGSFFDDPNGFSILMPLFLFIPLLYKSTLKKYIIFIIVLFCILVSQSGTGIISTFFSFTIVLILTGLIKNRKVFKIFSLLSVSILAISILILYQYFETLLLLLEMKKGSIYSRSDGFSIISSITDLVIPVNSGKLTESGYINLISIAGILIYPYFIFNFYIMIILIRKVRNELRRDRKLFYVGVLMFFVSYSIAMLNIPVSIVYPLNALYFYFLGILYCGSTNQNKLYELQN